MKKVKATIMYPEQVLITGNYRSGTEYLSNLLNHLKLVTSEMYTTNFLRNFHQAETISQFKNNIITHLYERKSVTIPQNIIDVLKNEDTVPRFIQSLYGYIATDSSIFIDKEQLAWKYYSFYKSIFPNGKVILVLRDPRAIMNSFRKFTVHIGDYYLTSCLNSLGLFQFIQKHQNCSDILVIRYEDLMLDRDSVVLSICNFLGVPFQRFVSVGAASAITGKTWNGNTTTSGEFDFIKSNTCWKSELNLRDIRLVDNICGEFYEKFNYEYFTKDLCSGFETKIFSTWVKEQFDDYIRTGNGMCKFPLEKSS